MPSATLYHCGWDEDEDEAHEEGHIVLVLDGRRDLEIDSKVGTNKPCEMLIMSTRSCGTVPPR